MKLKYYGTGAAEGWPGLFCRCDACAKARAEGGRSIRTRSQAALDGTLLIDLPPDTYQHVLYGGLDLAAIRGILITHDHSDHFIPHELWCRGPYIAYGMDEETIPLAGSPKVAERAGKAGAGGRIEPRALEPFVRADVAGYAVTPLPADHDPSAQPYIYIIERGGKTLLYAHDTGYFPDATWEYLEKRGVVFDFVSLDCTNCARDSMHGHMGLPACRLMREKLASMGRADAHTRFALNHFSHNGGLTYPDMCAAAPDFIVSYDGLEVEI